MWIVYTVNCHNNGIELCCYTHESEKGLNALDDYAIAKYRLKCPEYPMDKNPLEDESPMTKAKDGYYLRLDMEQQNGHGDSERVNLIKVKNGTQKILRYFHVSQVDKYIDDFLGERTQAVIKLEEDDEGEKYTAHIQEDSSDEDEDILDSSDEDSE